MTVLDDPPAVDGFDEEPVEVTSQPPWKSEIASLVARYRMSAASPAAPRLTARLALNDAGRIVAQGGKPEILAELKERRDDVEAFLRWERDRRCGRCGAKATRFSYWGEDLCTACTHAAAAAFDERGAWPAMPSDDGDEELVF